MRSKSSMYVVRLCPYRLVIVFALPVLRAHPLGVGGSDALESFSKVGTRRFALLASRTALVVLADLTAGRLFVEIPLGVVLRSEDIAFWGLDKVDGVVFYALFGQLQPLRLHPAHSRPNRR